MKKIFTKKVLILIICLFIIPIVLPNISFANDYNGDYSSRSALVSAKQNAVGKTIGFTQSLYYPTREVLGQYDSSDHMYCVKHNESSDDGLYTVDAYIHIEGNKATGYYIDRSTSKLTELKKTSNTNLGMAYILNAGNYDKYYCHNGVRNMAVHHYYSQNWFRRSCKSYSIICRCLENKLQDRME